MQHLPQPPESLPFLVQKDVINTLGCMVLSYLTDKGIGTLSSEILDDCTTENLGDLPTEARRAVRSEYKQIITWLSVRFNDPIESIETPIEDMQVPYPDLEEEAHFEVEPPIKPAIEPLYEEVYDLPVLNDSTDSTDITSASHTDNDHHETRLSPKPTTSSAPGETDPVERRLRILRQALTYGYDLEIEYYTRYRGVVTRRLISPRALEDDMYVRAFCHLRKDERVFRISRIGSMKVLK